MYRKFLFSLWLVMFAVAIAAAEDTGPNAASAANAANVANEANAAGEPGAKTLRGMSVLGNNEAPMSLFIVPWKSSELGVETNLNRTLNEHDVPVDRDVFMREIDFYQVSVGSKTK